MREILVGAAAIALRELLPQARAETPIGAEPPPKGGNDMPGGEVKLCGVVLITDANGHERWFRDDTMAEVDEVTARLIMESRGCEPGFGG